MDGNVWSNNFIMNGVVEEEPDDGNVVKGFEGVRSPLT
jgi:hypothetical protein